MHAIPLMNKHALLLVVLALFVNGIFLYFFNPKVYFAITQAHGQIGYNLYQHNVIGMNKTLTDRMNQKMREQGCLIDYDNVVDQQTDAYEPFPINDTVAYGVLLGLIWKITDSLKFRDLQILQLIIFSVLMLLYYQAAYLLFGNPLIAFYCGIMQLLFFPLIAYNVMPVRDVWAYYGLLILCYASLAYYYHQINSYYLVGYMSFFALCLWMRPTLACAALMGTLFFMIRAAQSKQSRNRSMIIITTLWIVTVLLFWLPFIYFNKQQYDRLLVSPAGQSLLEGLGEQPNKWGHKLNDEYVNRFISDKYQLVYGTVAFDEAAMFEFKECVKEEPWHYIKTLLFRLPDVLLPGLQWIFYEQSPYVGCNGIQEKLWFACSSWGNLLDFFMRHVWMRLYLLLGYIGLLSMLLDRRYKAVAFIMTCLISGLSTYPSHIEYRYIVPFYWVISFFVGFLLSARMGCNIPDRRLNNIFTKERIL